MRSIREGFAHDLDRPIDLPKATMEVLIEGQDRRQVIRWRGGVQTPEGTLGVLCLPGLGSPIPPDRKRDLTLLVRSEHKSHSQRHEPAAP